MSILLNGTDYTDGKSSVDIANKIVTFESEDTLAPESPAEMSLVETGGKMRNFMKTISIMAKNTRYLLSLLGTTDISAIADGTVTGGIKKMWLEGGKRSVYFMERIADSPIDPGGSVCVGFVSGVIFLQVTIPINKTINDWQSLKIGTIKNYTPGVAITCALNPLGNINPGNLLISVDGSGDVYLQTHGAVTINSWCYGCMVSMHVGPI